MTCTSCASKTIHKLDEAFALSISPGNASYKRTRIAYEYNSSSEYSNGHLTINARIAKNDEDPNPYETSIQLTIGNIEGSDIESYNRLIKASLNTVAHNIDKLITYNENQNSVNCRIGVYYTYQRYSQNGKQYLNVDFSFYNANTGENAGRTAQTLHIGDISNEETVEIPLRITKFIINSFPKLLEGLEIYA